MDKIVVFGATGSLGIYITDYLNSKENNSKYEVIAVGRKNSSLFKKLGIQYIQMDVTHEEEYEKLPSDSVYAVIIAVGLMPAHDRNNDPFAYVNTNIVGVLRILEYAKKNKADRVIYLQTWAELGGYWDKEEVLFPDMPRKLIYTGDHAFYAITKTMIVETLEHYKQEFGIKNFVFRLPNIYHYNPEKHYYVNGIKKAIGYRRMIDLACAGKPIEMWGDPEAFKDIIYIKDLCQLVFKALHANVYGGMYNAGTGIKTTLREQIEGIIKIFSKDVNEVDIILKPEKEKFTSFVMDINKAKIELGYEPEYTYLKYLEDYKKEMQEKRFDSLWRKSNLL